MASSLRSPLLNVPLSAWIASLLLANGLSAPTQAQLPTGWKAHDLSRPAPKVVTPADKPGGAPSDAIVLFDGKDLSKWRSGNGGETKWKIVDGAMESVAGAGYIFSKQQFGDCQVHVEWASPAKVKGNGQGRGNSGVFLMGLFEVQVLDSFNNPTYSDGGAGSVYGQYPPLVNASRGPGQWQSYDIIFFTARYDDEGRVTQPARITVLHNGVLIQDHVKVFGPTAWIAHNTYPKNAMKGALSFQDHGNPVRYRNVWVRPLKPRPQRTESYAEQLKLSDDEAKKYVGKYGRYQVTHQNGKLLFRFRGREELLEMTYLGDDTFAFRKSAGKAEFVKEGDSMTLKLELDAAGKDSAKRN